jgi:hypothetical protein
MKTGFNARIAGLACVLGGAMALGAGCEQGPGEKAGAKVDQAVRDAKDKLNPPGPAEKAGRAVDDALKP